MKNEWKKLANSVLIPFLFLVIVWLIKLVEVSLDISFVKFGNYPLKVKGLVGIIASPLIHSDYEHLISNSFPFFFLLSGVFYFYREVAFRILILAWVMSGLWVWMGARPAYHIGASGLVYAFGAFLFFSGVIRRHTGLLAVSMLVTFLYGSMVWGVFPLKLEDNTSWESHMMGAVAGIVLSVYFRKYGPQRKKASWELEEELMGEEDDIPDIDFGWINKNNYPNSFDSANEYNTVGIKYYYIARNKRMYCNLIDRPANMWISNTTLGFN